MANTYSQSYFHLIFAVKNRQALIAKPWKRELEKYISGIIKNKGHKLIAIGGMPDHIHIFIGYNLNQPIPELVEQIKTSSNNWIKEKELCRFNFKWQKGYGAFSHSRSQINQVSQYVLNQEEHHRSKTFKEEYIGILNNFQIEYQDKYLFDFMSD